MSKKTSTPTRVEPLTVNPVDAQKLIESAKQILAAFSSGTIQIQDGAPAVDRPTIREMRIANTEPSDGLAYSLRNAPEPRRQRKQRNLPPRKIYTLKAVKSREAMKAIQNLTPAASSIVVYLATHQKATVNDLTVQLDLKRKTIENLLSVLRQADLVDSHDA